MTIAVNSLDLKVDQIYLLPGTEAGERVLTRFEKELYDGRLRFAAEKTGREIDLEPDRFAQMRSDGLAIRVPIVGRRVRDAIEIEDVDPASLLDPDQQTITLREQARRRAAWKRLQDARTLRWYTIRYDEEPDVGKGHVGVREFISAHRADARMAGFEWVPSPGALLRAVDECGIPGERPLSAFFNRRGLHDRSQRWHAATVELAARMVAAYWSDSKPPQHEVISQFYEAFDAETERREALGEAPLARPTAETLRNWINGAENYWNYRARHGAREANRRFRGRGRSVEATRPGQVVVFDHTRVDAWAAVYDEGGIKILEERPWLTLAIDVYSRMVLGAVLTYEPPSLHSVMLCLRQVVRRKKWLIDEFGEHKGATDGWCKPATIVVDNGWEFVGISFQVVCEAAGIDVIWAPIHCPEFKAHVERAFSMLNTLLWHRLDSGVPYKPHEMTRLRLDPKVKALAPKEHLEELLWRGIVTIYHVEEHSGIGMAPARRWREGIANHGRETVDDVAALDAYLGRTERCLLTAEGVRVNGMRFHDPVTTTKLLDRLLRYAAKRTQRSRGSSGTVHVLVTWDPGDCSFVHVWDFKAKKNIRLPAWDRRFADGCSWSLAKKIQDFAREQNLAFHSDAEKHAARAAYARKLREELPDMKFGTARRHARDLDPTPRLPEDADLVIKTVEPSRPEGEDVPTLMPARERTDDRIPPMGPRRGGRKATSKAVATRLRRRKTSEPAEPTGRTQPKSVETKKTPGVEWTPLETEDAEARLAQLAEDLD